MRYSGYFTLLIIVFSVQNYCGYGQKKPDFTYHIVKSDQNVYRISLIYKVPMDSIKRWNYLDRDYKVIIGQRLIVYGRKLDTIQDALATSKKIPPSAKSSPLTKTISVEKLTTNKGLGKLSDTTVISEKVLFPDSSLTAQQPKSFPLYSEPVEKDKGSTFYEIVEYYYHNSNYLFQFVLFLNLFFLTSSFILAFGLIFRRIKNGYIQHKRLKCQDRYRDFITEWLYDEGTSFVPDSLINELKDSVYRDVFTSELLSLHKNLSGESAERLTELYNLAGFKKYSIQKINRSFWHMKAKGFRELAQMKIKENYMIFKYLNSGNVTLSIEAQLAWIQLNPDDPLSFYDDPNVKLTEWGQLNLLIALRKSGRLPDFGKWLLSSSKSVSLFALRMEGIFKDFENVDLVAQRLDDNDRDIRHAAICTLGKIALHAPGYKLQRLFPNEELENKTEIIRSLTMMSESTNVPFFESVLLNETDVNLRILAGKGLVSLGDIGNNRLDSLLLNADPILIKIINHAKDDRI